MIAAHRIVALVSPESSPIRRMVRQAKDDGRAIDMTSGRKTKTVIIMDSGHVALAALHPETIASRLRGVAEHEAPAHERAE